MQQPRPAHCLSFLLARGTSIPVQAPGEAHDHDGGLVHAGESRGSRVPCPRRAVGGVECSCKASVRVGSWPGFLGGLWGARHLLGLCSTWDPYGVGALAQPLPGLTASRDRRGSQEMGVKGGWRSAVNLRRCCVLSRWCWGWLTGLCCRVGVRAVPGLPPLCHQHAHYVHLDGGTSSLVAHGPGAKHCVCWEKWGQSSVLGEGRKVVGLWAKARLLEDAWCVE